MPPQLLLGLTSPAGIFLYAGIALAVLGAAVGLWFLLAPGPRARRAYSWARRLLQQGDWQKALETAKQLQNASVLGRKRAWLGRLANLEGSCYRGAGDRALLDKRYEESLQAYVKAAPLLGLEDKGFRIRVIEAMLAEARALFASGADSKANAATQQLVSRILLLQSPCAEASFWLALCHVREGRNDLALSALAAAHEAADKQYLDPPLYLGALLLREGRAPEALRYLSEANRIDASCPFVPWQLGVALEAAGTDAGMAVRTLQKALGPRGLGLYSTKGQRAWSEAFPENRSYVRRLATRHPFTCPVFGSDLPALVRQGQFALAQAQYRAGNFTESAELYTQLLRELPPSPRLLRGLGLALARLDRYDEAFKYLRTALEQEEPKTHVTAGYLALCGALGKPTKPEDKPVNVAWAIRLLSQFDVLGDAEWARLGSRIFAEARRLEMAVAAEDQRRLCDVLASVHAADAEAAAAYDRLAASAPELLRPEHAWLYCRAAQQAGFTGRCDLDLFGRTLRDREAAQAFFAGQGWDFDAAEYTYLEHAAVQRPGRFPDDLGPEYPVRGEAFLLDRSRQLEEAGQSDAALASADVLLRLAPNSLPVLDRLAYLYHRRGDLERSAALLAEWHTRAPADYWPLVRQAVIEQQRGHAASRTAANARALELTRGPLRAAVAFLGARLAIADCRLQIADWKDKPVLDKLHEAILLLQECLKEDPDHTDALWHLAAARWVAGDHAGVAALAAAMNRPAVPDPRFHYLAAVCHLAAGDAAQVLKAGQRVLAATAEKGSGPPAGAGLDVEVHYLMGWAHLQREDLPAAAAAFQKVADVAGSPSAEHARALLGHIGFTHGSCEEAIRWWTAVDPKKRSEWRLDDALRSTVFAAGLLAYQDGRFEQAAGRFCEAGRLGVRERRLGQLMILSLVKAGQQLLYAESEEDNHETRERHEKARQGTDEVVVLELAPE
jgi:tetratricopeptide (TPR) repeat protein